MPERWESERMDSTAEGSRLLPNLGSRVRSPSPASANFSGCHAGIRSYLLAAAVDDAAFIWIRPIPSPPTAPASSPSKTKTGMLSSSVFFSDFTILFSLGNCCSSQSSICPSIPGSGKLRKRLWQ